MIVYFLIEAKNPSASILIVQPQKNKIKVIKFGSDYDQWDFVKTHIVNDPLNSQLHVFRRNLMSEIIHQAFNIKSACIDVPQF